MAAWASRPSLKLPRRCRECRERLVRGPKECCLLLEQSLWVAFSATFVDFHLEVTH